MENSSHPTSDSGLSRLGGLLGSLITSLALSYLAYNGLKYGLEKLFGSTPPQSMILFVVMCITFSVCWACAFEVITRGEHASNVRLRESIRRFDLQANFDKHLEQMAGRVQLASARVIEIQGQLKDCPLEDEPAIRIDLIEAEQQFRTVQAEYWTDARFVRELGFKAPEKSFKESLAPRPPDDRGTPLGMLA